MGSKTTGMVVFGRLLMGSLKKITAKYSKAAREAFANVQDRLEQASRRVDEASEAVEEATARVSNADDVQDAAALDLAVKLVADGFNRSNPFRAFGALSPSEITNLGSVPEAKALLVLAANVSSRSDVSAETKRFAATVAAAAEAVRDAAKAQNKSLRARTEAIAEREAIRPAWEKAIADLRTTIRYTDYVDGTESYDEIFQDLAEVKKRKKVAEDVAL